MKSFPLFLLMFTVIVSWAIGFYFISIIKTPTIIIPLVNDYLWMNEYKGFLGLPILFSLTTVPAVLYFFRKRDRLKKTWYTAFSASQSQVRNLV
ncbi:hypothetical protein [Halobacillus salinus]|uniref:hypothetical protein n=1 Tax=Halobacillus salinus TaxID=192814 RepID=UPI0009A60081|nr:hypothetical protein [Halobacillus salinus]